MHDNNEMREFDVQSLIGHIKIMDIKYENVMNNL